MPADSEFIGSIVCPKCHAELPPGETHCARCDSRKHAPLLATVVDDADAPVNSESTSTTDKRWFVLTMLFGVTMFLGLPLLWKSKAYGQQGKVILTILVIAYSIVVFWIFFLIMSWSYSQIRGSI
jgi:hypothetical protein